MNYRDKYTAHIVKHAKYELEFKEYCVILNASTIQELKQVADSMQVPPEDRSIINRVLLHAINKIK